ncbi:MAG: MGMT family protein [Chloroflexota bacterium]
MAGRAPSDRWTEADGPAGPLLIAWGLAGVFAVTDSTDPAELAWWVGERLGRSIEGHEPLPRAWADAVERALAGEPAEDLLLDLSGVPVLEAEALRAARTIPFGEARPYAWVAREIGRPRAVRAVGTAMARTPVPFLVPCHRVIRSDGHVGDYGAGGAVEKRAMLRLEGVDPDELDMLADRGIRYLGDLAASRFCYPTCARVRALPADARIAVKRAEIGFAAGLAPCDACRPVVGSPFA